MAADSCQVFTQPLQAWSRGDSWALKKLTPLTCKELPHLADDHQPHEHSGHTLQTTAAVNEAYRLLVCSRASWQNGRHFSALSTQDGGRSS